MNAGATEWRHMENICVIKGLLNLPRGIWDKRIGIPDYIGGGQSGQESHGQPEAKVVGPVPLDVGQPLVHLNA